MRNEQWGHSVDVCVFAHAALRMLLGLSAIRYTVPWSLSMPILSFTSTSDAFIAISGMVPQIQKCGTLAWYKKVHWGTSRFRETN